MKDKPLLVIIGGLDGRDISAHQLTAGENLSKRVMEISPNRFNRQSVTVYRNSITPENQIPLETVPFVTVQPEDFFLLRSTPATGTIMPVLSLAATVAVSFIGGPIAASLLLGSAAVGALGNLIAAPQLPSGETNRDQASGLNTVGTPHNIARLRSRVPEIFGLMRIWPDLAIPPIEEWSGRSQKVTCLYCVGVGFYQISQYKLNETAITSLPGVAVTQYGPAETMPGLIVARESDTQQQIELDATGASGGDFSAWITAVGDQVIELWVEIGFPSGLVIYKSSGGKRNETTQITIEWQRMDIDGDDIHSHQYSFTAATGNPLRYTVKVTPLPPGVYRCRAKRNDDGSHGDDDVHVSNVALIKVIGIEVLPSNSAQTYRNTFVKLVIDNNDQVAQLSALTFNLMVKRMLHLVLPAGEVSPHFTATSFMRDAIYYCLHDPALGNLFSSDIDLVGLYDLHAKLKSIGSSTGGEDDDNTDNAEFNGVFDRWSSVDEMVQTIAQIGRAAAIYDGGRMIFMRDEDKLAPVSVFNRRVRPAEDESTRNLAILTPDQEDGISIDWKDADNGYVDRTYVYPEDATNPKTIDLLGATHWEQVWRRAQYEWNRMALRRRTAKISVTEEGLIVNPLDVVTVVDPWLDAVTDGDIVDYDPVSRIATIDQKLVPSPGSIMRIRSIEGDVTDDLEFIVGTGETNKIRLLRDPVFPIVPRDYKHQVGNLYIMGTVGYMEQHDWHVIEVTARDRRQVELSLVEYAPDVFLCDELPVPDPPVLQ